MHTKTIALTGHTRGFGQAIFSNLVEKNHNVCGFSLSTGCDLRDYSQVGAMIDSIKDCSWFINCAHPDYCQTQILYRLLINKFNGKILNIGSPVVHQNPGWSDLGLMEYVTQKTALWHACNTLSQYYPDQILLWEPMHTTNKEYINSYLTGIGL